MRTRILSLIAFGGLGLLASGPGAVAAPAPTHIGNIDAGIRAVQYRDHDEDWRRREEFRRHEEFRRREEERRREAEHFRREEWRRAHGEY